ncbi:hypothetical protein ACFVT2_02585 [Streptomyces sp. NPDC058000]|uniref:hypothetical protein n=1 Tax=Streptomyces sp. NPDC058000 TaxID=3346299 RepID=UPI0036EF0C29
MRTRMAATAVFAAAVLTLTGSTVATASGKDTPRRSKDSPVKMAACALGSALGALTGGDDSCMRDRLDRMDRAREMAARKALGEHRRAGKGRGNELGRFDMAREDGLSRGETLPRM